jgi:hypothetical protein
MVLQELNLRHLLNHHHDLWGVPTTAKSCTRNADDLLKNEVENPKGLLLDIDLDEVPLILRTSGGISNPRSQGSTEEAVKCKQLWQEVLDLWCVSLGARSIHKLHFLQLEHIIGVNLSL